MVNFLSKINILLVISIVYWFPHRCNNIARHTSSKTNFFYYSVRVPCSGSCRTMRQKALKELDMSLSLMLVKANLETVKMTDVNQMFVAITRILSVFCCAYNTEGTLVIATNV